MTLPQDSFEAPATSPLIAKSMTPRSAFQELFGKRQNVMKPGLDRMRAAQKTLARNGVLLGHGIPTFIIGGTNGKGSTAGMLWRLAAASGLRVGLYSSPHLISFAERFVVSGTPITEDEVDTYLGELRRNMPPELFDELSFFELATLLSFWIFRERQVELQVIEVGLGGRLDSTNVVDPLGAAIVSIGMDHCQYLGNTLTAIAHEKCGIARPGRPIFWGGDQPNDFDPADANDAAGEIWRHSNQFACPLYHSADHWQLSPDHLNINLPNLECISAALPKTIAARPEFLRRNFALSASIFWWLLQKLKAPSSSPELSPALRFHQAMTTYDHPNLPLPPTLWGRFHELDVRPWALGAHKNSPESQRLVVDVCHNIAGVEVFTAGLNTHYGQTSSFPALVSIMRDKDVNGILDLLRVKMAPLVLFKNANERSFCAEDLAPRHRDLLIFSSFEEAWNHAVKVFANPTSLQIRTEPAPWVICGSVMAVGEVLHGIRDLVLKDHLNPSNIVRKATMLLLSFLFFLVAQTAGVYAAENTPVAPIPEVIFDAKASDLTRDGQRQIFEGDVIAMGPGVIITADKIEVDRKTGLVEANGHILIVTKDQLLSGDNLTYQLANGDFKITKALISVNDHQDTEEVVQRILGFTPNEIAFETARSARLRELAERRTQLRDEARGYARSGIDLDERLIDRYVAILEQEELTTAQENPSLARMPEDRREIFKRRRVYWDAHRKADLLGATEATQAYFRLSGESIERTNGNDYRANASLFSPCHCAPGDSPDWAFRASETDAQIGGYADLYNAVLEIKGVPILYLPYMKLPIKTRRQSGFIMPQFGFNKKSRNIYSQPVFFDFGAKSDGTLTADFFERRGTRLGAEMRYQQREFSGWTLNIDAMRDQLWLTERAERDSLADVFRSGLAVARKDYEAGIAPTAPTIAPAGTTAQEWLLRRTREQSYWLKKAPKCEGTPEQRRACEQAFWDASAVSIDRALAVPVNPWRGSAQWRGLTFFAPRFSFVSHGEIFSDHRYNEELYLPDSYHEALYGARELSPVNRTKARFHLDGEEFYLGLGLAYGDYVRLNERFEGEQLPATFTAQSRLFRLTSRDWSGPPIYAQVLSESFRISEQRSDLDGTTTNPNPDVLGEGTWQRAKINLTSPLITKGIAKVEHFTELEARGIDAAGLKPTGTSIRSWRTGFRFQLPLDGKGPLPDFLQSDSKSPDSTRYLHHLMNWSMTLSARPVAVRNGPYGRNAAEIGADNSSLSDLTYFLSDSPRPVLSAKSGDVVSEDSMTPHQIVKFETTHRWRLFSRGWEFVPGSTKADQALKTDEQPPASDDFRSRARRELLHAGDRPATNLDDVVSPDGSQFYVNRYRLSDSSFEEPLTFSSGISYDFVKAQKRLEIDAVDLETRPWTDPYMQVGISVLGWALNNRTVYGLYDKIVTLNESTLAFPRALETQLVLGYGIGTLLQRNPEGDVEEKRTRTQAVDIASNLIPQILTNIRLKQQFRDDDPDSKQYETAYGMSYASRSGCWGMQFARSKLLAEAESDATYVLSLQIIFGGQARGFDMSRSVLKQVDGDNQGS